MRLPAAFFDNRTKTWTLVLCLIAALLLSVRLDLACGMAMAAPVAVEQAAGCADMERGTPPASGEHRTCSWVCGPALPALQMPFSHPAVHHAVPAPEPCIPFAGTSLAPDDPPPRTRA